MEERASEAINTGETHPRQSFTNKNEKDRWVPSGLNEQNTLSEETSKLQNKKLLGQLFGFATNNNFSVAIWRLPTDGKTRMIVDVGENTAKVKIDLEEIGQGFIFSPFSNLDNSTACFIHNDIELTEGDEMTFSEKINYQERNRLADEISAWTSNKTKSANYYSTAQEIRETTKKDFCTGVLRAVESFDEGRFQKVVLSRCKTVNLLPTFDILETFFGLCHAYPNAFVSVTAIPNVGTWIGASPEVLISVDKNKIFRTAAVAGTQLHHDDINLADVGWRQKDIEEQAMVSRYIINCFKKIRLREFEEIGPRTARAGNVVHLKTDFHVDMQAVAFPQLGSVMLGLLHPTSAVCGMPREAALEFIENNEKYDRSYYSGFLGPVNIAEESHLYVNIRCMQLLQKNAVLYGGAGITHESNPEKEWDETDIKMNTLLDLMAKMGYAQHEGDRHEGRSTSGPL
jgi:isochorismate synthase